MLNQFPKKAINHIFWRVERAQHNLTTLKTSVSASSRAQYYRTALFPKYELPTLTLASLGVNHLSEDALIMDEICMPPYYSFDSTKTVGEHWANDHDDIRPLLALIAAQRPKIIVELGTAHGNTTANICNQNPDTKIYTVNAPVEEQTGDITTFDLTRDEVGCVYKQHNFSQQVIQIYKNTLDLELSEHFSKPLVDIAIIDACHDENYVINDFLKVEPYISPGGLVLFHDTHPSLKNHLVGSYVGCMKLRAKGYDIRHLENTWWGVWTKNIS